MVFFFNGVVNLKISMDRMLVYLIKARHVPVEAVGPSSCCQCTAVSVLCLGSSWAVRSCVIWEAEAHLCLSLNSF